MASEKKLRKLEEVYANSDVDENESDLDDVKSDEETKFQPEEKHRPLFPPTDVILEVEGRPIHVNKQTLADSSPVFKKMFESDFKEKHMNTIPLPDKKYEDFEKFVFLIYNPGAQYQIISKFVCYSSSILLEKCSPLPIKAANLDLCWTLINEQWKLLNVSAVTRNNHFKGHL